MKIERFEDILAWQKARELNALIYKIFRNIKDFKFVDQIRSASVSTMNNIAEGFERGTNKDFRRFLFIAKGSSAEVRSMLYVSNDVSYINQEQFNKLCPLSTETSKLLSGLIKTLKS